MTQLSEAEVERRARFEDRDDDGVTCDAAPGSRGRARSAARTASATVRMNVAGPRSGSFQRTTRKPASRDIGKLYIETALNNQLPAADRSRGTRTNGGPA